MTWPIKQVVKESLLWRDKSIKFINQNDSDSVCDSLSFLVILLTVFLGNVLKNNGFLVSLLEELIEELSS